VGLNAANRAPKLCQARPLRLHHATKRDASFGAELALARSGSAASRISII
jgi:hypothetical protein